MRMYGDLADWYDLIDPVADHEDEAAMMADLLARAGVAGGALLELGCGAGNNARWLRDRYDLTLTDLNPEMLARSQAQNPGCAHVLGDMRSLRLGRRFDAVLVHDAVCYLSTEADLRALAETIAVHLRPGGVALVSPDTVREAFFEATDETFATDGHGRALFMTEWSWDPDPDDTSYRVEFVLQLRRGAEVQVVHDPHEEGLFPVATWLAALASAGLEVEAVEARADEVEGTPYTSLVFVARAPLS